MGMKPPKLDTKVTDALTGDELKALIKACAGKGLRERRDEAIVRLMAETGVRAGEIVAMQTADIDLTRGIATVRRGKGGKGRIVPFGPQTADRHRSLSATRRTHMRADNPELWVGDRGKGFSYDGLYVALRYRAQIAGHRRLPPAPVAPHRRDRWLAAGGSEGGLMAVAGWATPRHDRPLHPTTAADRAAAEARGLNLGDL